MKMRMIFLQFTKNTNKYLYMKVAHEILDVFAIFFRIGKSAISLLEANDSVWHVNNSNRLYQL